MEGVVATGIGPKLTSGQPTQDLALHFFVRRKVASSKLAKTRRIPKTIGGYATDILPGSKALALDAFSVPGEALNTGYGQPVLATSGERGTVGCCAIGVDGASVLITAGHVVPPGGFVMDDSGSISLGATRSSFGAISGETLYPGTTAGSRPCALDAAVVVLNQGVVPHGGLPSGHSFLTQPWRDTFTWILQNARAGTPAEAAALGPVHTGGRRHQVAWRRGAIISSMVMVVADGITYFCAIDDHGASEPGDSGSLWIGNQSGNYIAIGLHHGILNQTGYALVTDLASALPHIGIQRLLGN